MADFDALNEVKANLIRKAKGGFILTAPLDTEVPEKIMETKTDLVDFKTLGFTPLGWLSKSDGVTFNREVETSEVESFGASEPTRVDITSDSTSAAFVCQETNKAVLELFHNQDLSKVKADENGEVVFAQERTPDTVYRRFIHIAKDGNGDNAIYIAKVMPRGTIVDPQEQAWSNEDELKYGMSVSATSDQELGFAVRHHFGGPGWIKLLKAMGFDDTAVTPVPNP